MPHVQVAATRNAIRIEKEGKKYMMAVTHYIRVWRTNEYGWQHGENMKCF